MFLLSARDAYIDLGTEGVQLAQFIRNPVFDWVFPYLTQLGEGPAVILAALAVAVFYAPRRPLGAAVVGAFLIASLLNLEIKETVGMPRPSADSVETFGGSAGYATPSAHTMIAASCWFLIALTLHRGWWTLPIAAVPLVVGFTRIYMGAHYPADVMLGLVLGGAIALLLHAILVQPERSRLSFTTYSPCVVLLVGVAFVDVIH